MGCTESSTQACLPDKRETSELNKKLIELISVDNVTGLAWLEAQQDFPANLELSEDGTMWTALHFCCRYDSAACLDYLLKKCYLQNVKRYIESVNKQTSEGFTCLHLCGMWAAFKCFFLLLKYGGINLSILDSKHRSAEAIMTDNGLTEMAKTIKALKTKKSLLTEWNYQLLHNFSEVPLLRCLEYHRQQFTLSQDKGESLNYSKVQVEHQDEEKIWSQKLKLQKQCDQLFVKLNQKLKKLYNQKQKPQNEGAKQVQTSTDVESPPERAYWIQIEKSEDILLLQREIQEKQQQIQRLKIDLRRCKDKRFEEAIEIQNKKIDLQKQQTKDSMISFSNEFTAFKQNLKASKSKFVHIPKVSIPMKEYRKGKEAKGSRSNSSHVNPTDDPNFEFLPQSVQSKFLEAKSQGVFQDDQFPHTLSSFGQNLNKQQKDMATACVWLRPTQFLSPNFVLFDGIEPNDVKQGSLGVCYFLATISSLALHPERVRQIFVFSDTEIGFYVIRLYINGKADYIVLDDYFPCSSRKQPLFAKPHGNQIWVLLIQKAWAKVIGSYFSAQGMNPRPLMEDLSGSPVLGNFFMSKTRDINHYARKDRLIVVSTSNQRMIGIVKGHAYSLLKVIEHNGAYIYKVRNPWGQFEWSGYYGDKSPQWTPELREKCQQVKGNDGVFFMSERELLRAFDYYNIELGQASCQYNYFQFQSQPGQFLYFRFKLTQKNMMAVKISQYFDRMLAQKDKEYKYSSMILELGRVKQNNEVIMFSQGNSILRGDTSTYAFPQKYKQFEAGNYFVRACVLWANAKKYNKGVLGVFCDEVVTIQRISQSQGKELSRKINRPQRGFLNVRKEISYSSERTDQQMIYIAMINPNAEGNCYRVRFSFQDTLFKNCRTSHNKLDKRMLEFYVTKEEPINYGSLCSIVNSKEFFTGNQSVFVFKEQSKKSSDPQKQQEQIRRQNQEHIRSQQRQLKRRQLVQGQKPVHKQQIQRQQNKQQQINNANKQSFGLDPKMSKLPQKIRQKYKAAKERGRFEDQEFPHKQSSLGGDKHRDKIEPFTNMLVWLRPTSFLKGNYTLLDRANPDDIRQGQVDTSYCLAALANYARTPFKIAEFFAFYDIELGFYVLKFYTNGKINYVVIDDYIPCDSSTNQPLFSFPVGNKIWVLLVEKAWAKICGSYFAAQELQAAPFMQDITGGPTYAAWFEEEINKTQALVQYSKKGYSIVLRACQEKIQGIVANLDYSLLKVIQYKGSNIYKIRNPWAEYEWNGEYGETSSRWTNELKKICDQKKGNDGEFFLSEKQLLKAFVYYSVGLDEPNMEYSFIEFRSKQKQNLYFKFKLKNKQHLAVKLTQPFKGTVPDEDYQYSPAIFEMGKIEGQSVTFLNEGDSNCSFGKKSMHVVEKIYDQYEPGEYFIRVKMNWVNPNQYNSAVLSLYCGQSVEIERLNEPQGFKLWKQLAKNFMQEKDLNQLDKNICYGMEWMKGQMICYAVLNSNAEQANYKVIWTFNAKNLVNCRLGLNKVNEQKIEFMINKNERFNIGTVESILLSEPSDCGSVEVEGSRI